MRENINKGKWDLYTAMFINSVYFWDVHNIPADMWGSLIQ